MANDNNRKERDWPKWIVFGTWALVVASLISTWYVKGSMDAQVVELKKATELEWRPYLNIELVDKAYTVEYRLGDSDEADTVFAALDQIGVSSNEFLAVRYLSYYISRKITFGNTGKTPLYIRRIVPSAMSESEWVQDYQEDPELLVKALLEDSTSGRLDVDVVVLPNETIASDTRMGTYRRMNKEEFIGSLKTNDTIIFYPYTFVEYEDFFTNKYNLLVIELSIAPMKIVNDKVLFPRAIANNRITYMWDVLLEE